MVLLESLQQLQYQSAMLSSAYLNGCAALLKQRLMHVHELTSKATAVLCAMSDPDQANSAGTYDNDSASLLSDDDDDGFLNIFV